MYITVIIYIIHIYIYIILVKQGKPLLLMTALLSMFEGFWLNSLAPRRFQQKFREVIFKPISVTDGWDISCKIALRWMPLDLIDDKSTLVQVMAWCHQATSHYLSQCWPRFMLPYGVTRPQWVKDTDVQRQLTDVVISCGITKTTELEIS